MRPRRIPTVMIRIRTPRQMELKKIARDRGISMTDLADEIFKKEIKRNVTKKKLIRR